MSEEFPRDLTGSHPRLHSCNLAAARWRPAAPSGHPGSSACQGAHEALHSGLRTESLSPPLSSVLRL